MAILHFFVSLKYVSSLIQNLLQYYASHFLFSLIFLRFYLCVPFRFVVTLLLCHLLRHSLSHSLTLRKTDCYRMVTRDAAAFMRTWTRIKGRRTRVANTGR